MGVVALSMVSIGLQSVTDGISTERAKIADRNIAVPTDTSIVAVAIPEDIDAAFLNEIETAAGDDTTGNENFGSYFTNTTPDALSTDEMNNSGF